MSLPAEEEWPPVLQRGRDMGPLADGAFAIGDRRFEKKSFEGRSNLLNDRMPCSTRQHFKRQ